jgi:hypothetical protein
MGWLADIAGSAAIISIVYLVRYIFILAVHLTLACTRAAGDSAASDAKADVVGYGRDDAVAESFVDGIFFSDALQDKRLLGARNRRGVLLCAGLSGLALGTVIALEVGFVFLDSGRTRDALRTDTPAKLDLLPQSKLASSNKTLKLTETCFTYKGSSPYATFDERVEYNTACVDMLGASAVGAETTDVPTADKVTTNIAVLAATTGPDGTGPRVFVVVPKRAGEPLNPSIDAHLRDRTAYTIRFRALLETLDRRNLVSYVVLPSLATQDGAERARTVFHDVMVTTQYYLDERLNRIVDGNVSCRPVPIAFTSGQEPSPRVFGAHEFGCRPAVEIQKLAAAVLVAVQGHVGLSESTLELEDGEELTAVFGRTVVRGIPFSASIALIAGAVLLLLAKLFGARKQLSLDRFVVLVAAGGASLPLDESLDWKIANTSVRTV